MKRFFYILQLLIFSIVLWSCEKEAEPFTLNDLFELNGLPTKPFELNLNDTKFETTTANGLKGNTGLVIAASSNEVSYALGIADVLEANYLGSIDPLKNYLNYKDTRGQIFSTTKPGKNSDIEIEISKYDPLRMVVSGNFKGTLYSRNGDLELSVTNGSFLEVPVVQPLFGEMTALIDNRQFVAESCTFTSNNFGGFVFETFVGIGNSDSTTITITVEQQIEEREYTFSAGGLTAVYVSNTFSTNVFKNRYEGDSGSLLINRIDTINNSIQGVFNFTLRNAFGEPVEISNGNFNALIQ